MTAMPVRLETPWQRRLAGAGSCACLGVLAAVAGGTWPAFLPATMLGSGIAGASLLLAWGVDAALGDLSGRLVILAAAVVTTLPELTVEAHLAFTRQADLVSANLTGATCFDLVAAVALPVVGAAVLRARGQPTPPLRPGPSAPATPERRCRGSSGSGPTTRWPGSARRRGSTWRWSRTRTRSSTATSTASRRRR